jgi:hypothetical protein
MWPAQDIRALGHKMHATEDDIVRFGARGGVLRQLERIAAIIGVFDNLIALIVVSQDNQARTQRRFGRCDTPIQFLAVHLRVEEGNGIHARRVALACARVGREQGENALLFARRACYLHSH